MAVCEPSLKEIAALMRCVALTLYLSLPFQSTPFAALQYTLLGDDSGPTFFRIDNTSGRVYVKQDLKPDAATQYTVSSVWFNFK